MFVLKWNERVLAGTELHYTPTDPRKKKHDLTSKRGHLHISRFISVTEKHIYLVAAKFNTSKSCGLWKSQVCFLKWPTHTFLDRKSDIIDRRLYFLTTGKMPIFLESECWQLQTDISRRENGAHVRIRIRPAWQARGINRDGGTRETLSWCRLQIIIIMMIMTMTMIMVINYNNDRGFGFSDIWFLTLNSLPIYSSVPLWPWPLKLREQICAASCINWRK